MGFVWLLLGLACRYASGDGDSARADSVPPDSAGETGGGDTGPPPPPDADGDRLPDADEAAWGTDPYDPDSDDDTYRDGDEVAEGRDPLDPESRIYIGYWPYNPDKEALDDPGWGGAATWGGRLPRARWVDQFGEEVDLYDFAGQGVPVVIDNCAIWCDWCYDVDAWLLGQPSRLDTYTVAWKDGLPPMVQDGRVWWITVLDEDLEHGDIDAAEVAGWYALYPNARVAVLADVDKALSAWLAEVEPPTIATFDEALRLENQDTNEFKNVLAAFWEQYGE